MPPTACPAGTQLNSGDIATIAGTGLPGHSGDDGQATAAAISTPYSGGIAVDQSGAIYISDTGNHVIRRIGLDGVITHVAGTGKPGFSGDNGPAAQAALTAPSGLAFDDAGDLYVTDSARIRKIDTAGMITTIAGTGATTASSGNDGPATAAVINAGQIGIGPDGSLYIDDTNNFRRIEPDGIIHAFAGTGVAGYSGDGGPALDARSVKSTAPPWPPTGTSISAIRADTGSARSIPRVSSPPSRAPARMARRAMTVPPSRRHLAIRVLWS